MSFEIKLLTNRIPELRQVAPQRAGQIVAKTARDIEAHAKQRAPVDTGALRSSIQAQQVEAFAWEVGVGVTYAVYVEYGTSRQAAQPYLTPAVEFVRPAFEAAIARLLEG